MSLSLSKPAPGEDRADSAERAAADGPADTPGGRAAFPSRLRVWWGQVLQDMTAEADESAPRLPSMAWPGLTGYHLFDRAGLGAVKTGTLVIFRFSWTLTCRSCKFALGLVHTAQTAKTPSEPASKPSESTGKEEAGSAAEGKDAKPAGKKGSSKKNTKKASASGVGNVIVAGLLVTGMGVMFVAKTVVPALAGLVRDIVSWVAAQPLDVARGTGAVALVFVMAARVVGGIVEALAVPEGEVAGEAPATEREEPQRGSGEPAPEPAGGEELVSSPEDDAETSRIRTYEWVRRSIKTRGNGTSVHLRELLLDLQNQEGGEGVTMADLRAGLGGHDIPVRPGVKAPASDHGGETRNRPGVHRADLPQHVTPLPDPESSHVHPLPTYQASEQA